MSITSNNYGQTTTTHSSNTPKVTKDFTLSDLSKMEEQAKQYRGMFTAAGYPMAIFTAPAQGLLTQEKALEVPALAEG